MFESAIFRSMGTDVEVLAAPAIPDGAVDRVRSFFAEAESRFSRFLPASELSLVNLSAGRPVQVSELFAEAFGEAVQAAHRTQGLYNPLLLPQLQAAGYTDSFDEMHGIVTMSMRAQPVADYHEIEISDATVTIPAGSLVDLGGFVKGWTVDRAAPLMEASANWCVNAGGDLLVRGPGPNGRGWVVGVEDPFSPETDIGVLLLRDVAVATSSTMRRRWQTTDGPSHHIIDPRTGRPAETDLASVTVLASSVAGAEVLAKQLLLLGLREAHTYAERDEIPVLMVDECGSLMMSSPMEAHFVL
jgi:thiamine biosynthesis lipoprotein